MEELLFILGDNIVNEGVAFDVSKINNLDKYKDLVKDLTSKKVEDASSPRPIYYVQVTCVRHADC